jgi:hypothetical protein
LWYTFPRKEVRLGNAGAFCFLGPFLTASFSVQQKESKTKNRGVNAATTRISRASAWCWRVRVFEKEL